MFKKNHILIAAGLLLFSSACSPTKRLSEGEYLLDKNEIHAQGLKVSKDELNEIIRLQPNRKILPWTRFHLHMYNIPSDERLAKARRRKNERLAKKNAERAEKGKPPKGPGKTKWEWLKEVVGEPPVILDTALVRSSTRQLSTYLVKKGYFVNTVRDSIVLRPNKQMATVHYLFDWEPPYRIDSIEVVVEDEKLERLVDAAFKFKHVSPGHRFNVDALSKDRNRLNRIIRDNGYFLFSKEYISYEVDSTQAGRKVDLTLRVENPLAQTEGDTLNHHKRFKIGRVIYRYEGAPETMQDTIVDGGYYFIGTAYYPLKTKVLTQNTFIRPDTYYSQSDVELTYRRLTGLSAMSHLSINIEEYGEYLDVFITLKPARRQSLALETQGTNTGGFLGIEGDLVYRHRNIFRGSETMEIRLNGGLQAQALITESNTSTEDIDADNTRFNTLEFGPSLSFRFPKFLLPIAQESFAKSANPSTLITASYNFQDRPDFTRNLLSTQFGYEWKESATKTHQINPLEISVIQIDNSEEFQARLDELNDQFLSDAYRDHFITASTYTFTYNEQNEPKGKNLFYFNGHAELGGNILRSIYSLSGQEEDSTGAYSIFGIRFSHYVKGQTDVRFYRILDSKRTVATRFAVGVGVPLTNLNVLPFSESFFGGGANGLRAWQARTIGPGGFFEPVVTYDKIGDIIIETNVEYRFNLIDYLDGAFFVDVGNIWLLEPDELRPEGDFAFDRFLSEMAFGVGTGLRIDFNYFLIRFDLAAQFKDPSLAPGERWIFQDKDQYNALIEEYNAGLEPGSTMLRPYNLQLNFNLGIGYPF
ncbi:MAG: BamA/TamA family outer membrane protein [Flavobacteriales bacterium]|nr:BamA/TamA family outer membrane protein [Flavobacteriales bacterium]